jgi:hypothetical protein
MACSRKRAVDGLSKVFAFCVGVHILKLKLNTVAMTLDQPKSPTPDRLQALRRMKAKKFSRYFLEAFSSLA